MQEKKSWILNTLPNGETHNNMPLTDNKHLIKSCRKNHGF